MRFSDLDGMGHVNNAVFLTYLEQARLAWFESFGKEAPMPLTDIIVARAAAPRCRNAGGGGFHVDPAASCGSRAAAGTVAREGGGPEGLGGAFRLGAAAAR